MTQKPTYEALELRIRDLEEEMAKGKRAEKAFLRNETLLNATQKLIKAGGWEWDIETQNMFWTEEVYNIHGYDPAEFKPDFTGHIALNLECYDPEDRPVIMDAFERCVKEGRGYDLEFPFTTKS